jgi:hypothetical protein
MKLAGGRRSRFLIYDWQVHVIWKDCADEQSALIGADEAEYAARAKDHPAILTPPD